LTQGEILGHNLYAYCSNNPVMNVDPSGFWKITFPPVFTVLIGLLGIILPIIAINLSFKSMLKLGKGGSVADILTYIICADLFVLLPSTIALAVQIFIKDFSNIIAAIALGGMVALTGVTGGLGGVALNIFISGLYTFLPDMYTSIQMVIAGIKGQSYKLNVGWWKWKWVKA